MKKDELRKIYLSKRKALSPGKHIQLSQQLCDQFFKTVELGDVSVLHIYLPIESKHEPDTWLIINRVRKEFPALRLSIPRVIGDRMENIYFEDDNQLEKARWNILEPIRGTRTPSEKIDLVVVPLLAFDLQGHRVGYGKGFYDRFLKECQPTCKKVGLSLFEPVEAIEYSENDIQLSLCISPTKTYWF
jgi:5-formyltetrahydrofolate cyclo-ligase